MKHSNSKNKLPVLLSIIFLFACTTSYAQFSNLKFSTRSPYKTIVSHIGFLSPSSGAYNPEVAAKTLGGDDYSTEQKIGLAIKLKQIYDKHGGLDLDEISNRRNYRNEDGDYIYTVFEDIPEIYLIREDANWVYSAKSVREINTVFRRYYPAALPPKRPKKENTEEENSKDSTQVVEKDSTGKPIIKNKPTTKPSVEEKPIVKPPLAKVDLSNPKATVTTFFVFQQDDNYHPELAAKTLESLKQLSLEDRITLSMKLKQIYDGLGLWIEIEDIPEEADYRDTTRHNKEIYVLDRQLPDFYLEKYNDKWMFSEASIQLIENKHRQVFPIGTDGLETVGSILRKPLGNYARNELFGLEFWQVTSLSVMFLGAWLAAILVSRIIMLFLGYVSQSREERRYIRNMFSSGILIIICYWYKLISPSLELSIQELQFLIIVLKVYSIFQVVRFFYNLIDLWVAFWLRKANENEDQIQRGFAPFFGMTAKMVIILIGIVFTVSAMGYEISGLLTGLSIGGVAVALAAQDTIKNLFGSIMIFMDRPFVIGDWVKADGVSGSIEQIGLRSTRIRTFENSVVSIPNSRMADFTIDNMGMRVFRRYKTYLRISYDTKPDQIDEFVDRLKEMIRKHPHTRKDFYVVNLNNIGLYSYDILFYIFFEAPTWGDELHFRHEVIRSIIKTARDLDIEFAIPPNGMDLMFMDDKGASLNSASQKTSGNKPFGFM
ncbi:mechanosensitive ion channel family protein [Flammeovirga agarivorans]|uniref:Mechanosensitive ion channel family protein n=1 Tax=Flammeovirga agarivorans TaxID=2726742 RepID=A0A7X8SGW3_9BACT|nr:mechanosensitive ion channel family protein [Flammeovirga agarivorans]NLR89903.1 mechanosensitive ion channel family protein [Flammeovirga agarivorans]